MTPAIPDPYARTEFRSRLVNYAAIAGCLLVEERLGYQLTIMQGVGGAPASGGTHLGKDGEGGQFVDLAPYDANAKEKAWRELVGIAWVRLELPGVWGPHEHCGVIFEARSNQRGIAPEGFAQIGKYDRGEDGLSGTHRDPHPFRPSPPVLLSRARYTETMRRLWFGEGGVTATPVTRARDALVEADADLGKAAALLKGLPLDNDAREELDNIQRQRTRIRATLTRLPKR